MKTLALALILLVIYTLLSLHNPHAMLSPGDVLAGHGNIRSDCFACHKAFGGLPDQKCMVCHERDKIGVDTSLKTGNQPVLFHHYLTSTACVSCHTDHQGTVAVNRLAFNHSLLPDSITQTCVQCHEPPADTLHTYVSTDCRMCHTTEAWNAGGSFNHDQLQAEIMVNCKACHRPPTDKLHAMAGNSCSECHTVNQWKPASFRHETWFVLDNDHNVDCLTCHNGKSYATYTCYGCHEHSESNIRSEHLEEGITNFSQCIDCHKSARKDDAENKNRRGGGESSHERHNREHDDD